jgi:hypothetical protein
MNVHRQPQNADFFTVATKEPSVAFESLATGPTFQPVGRPWRYEFPHRPSTSDPAAHTPFTVPFPEPAAGAVQAREFDAIPAQEPLPAGGPSAPEQKSE